MKNKHNLRQFLAFLLCVAFFVPSAWAQTDVTDLYLTNAGFDDSSSWQSDNIAASGEANSKSLGGWTLVKSAPWSSSGALGFGTSGQINGASIPNMSYNGSTGGALGISTGWGGICQYTQQVTLPPGKYRISYAAYNCLSGKTQSFNYIGFIPDSGEAQYGTINNFLYATWMTDEIIVELTEQTSGKISVGLGAVTEGSGNNAKVLIDYVKIEAYNAAETMMPGNDITPGSWTGNTGTYQNTYQEYYKGSHFTGDAMTSTTSVENGTYSADVYFHSHMAWISQVANDGTLNAYIKGNNVTKTTEIINNTGFAAYEPKSYHLDDIKVTDGKLVLTVGNSGQGGNWLTVKTKKITQMTTPKVSYGAFPLPSTPVTVGYWYQIDVPVAGTYTLSTDGEAVISYTQNESDLTTATFTTASGGDLNLTAGKLYLKSNEAVTVTLTPSNYAYTIDNAFIDKEYVQPGQIVTVAFNASTNDQSATLAHDYSGVTLNGSALTLTEGEKGFTFEVPSALAAAGEYELVIPAGALSYVGEAESDAQTLAVKTASVYDGTYFMKNQEGYYMARGNDWGTHATMDMWGLPVNITTDADNLSTIQFADNQLYLYNTGWDAYTDASTKGENTQWSFVLADGAYRLSSVQQSGKYMKYNSPDGNVFTDGDGTNGTIIGWKLQLPSEHATEMLALRAGSMSLASQTDGLSSKTYQVASPTATNEQFQGQDDIMSGTIAVYPGIYKFSIQAFHRIASNSVAQNLHTQGADCPPVYAYFGDAKVQLKSVYEEYPQGSVGTDNSYNGHNYPNGQAGALTSFKEGLYTNTIYVRVTEAGTLNYGITNQGKAGANSHWTCYATDGIEITRYYDKATDGLDPDDQAIADLANAKYAVGDLTDDGKISLADITALVNIVTGRTKEYNAKAANVDGIGDVDGTDVSALVQWAIEGRTPDVVDETWRFANLEATVYTEQKATENANGANYGLTSAKAILDGSDVSDKLKLEDYLTTLNITTTLSDVVSVSIYAKGKENIAGLMSYNTLSKAATYSAGNSPSAYASTDQANKNMYSDVVTVTGDNAGTYVAYLLPVSLSNGVTVTIRDNNGKFYSQDFTVTAGQGNNLTFTETTATNNWMATIPGNINFSMISTPGSHDSATSSVSSYVDLAKCQNETIAQQLANGVRAFDLRPQYKSSSTITADNLTIYHGIVSTGVLYKDAIATITSFLDEHPSEAISIIMTKESASGTDQTSTLISAITEIHNQYSSYFKVMDHSYYTLDDFRGKIFYGCRPNWYVNTMTRVENWPDDSSVTDYTVNVGYCKASVEDAYNTSGNSKKNVVNAMLDLASANTDRARFHYTFTSVANSITSSAQTQNPAAESYISGTLTGPTGYVYGDFMGSSSYSGNALLKAIINQNYKYVYKGRSRCQQ